MTAASNPPRNRRSIPLALGDFLRPNRVALVMWDMQNGLAGAHPISTSLSGTLPS